MTFRTALWVHRGVLASFCLVLLFVQPVAASPPGGEQLSPETFALSLIVYVVVPSVIFAGLALVVMRVVSGGITRVSDARSIVSPLLVGVGLLVAANSQVSLVPSFMGGQFPWAGLGSGFVVLGILLSRRVHRARHTYRSLVVVVCLAVLVAGVVTAIGATFVQSLTPATASRVAFVVPLFGLLPAGYAFAGGKTRLEIATTALAFAVPMLGIVILETPGVGGNGLLFLLLEAVYGFVIATVGGPLLAVGASLSPEST